MPGQPEMSTAPGHILIVCTANICRSPMAERLLKHALAAEPEPLASIPVISAGVAARPGEYPSENSVFALRKVGIDLSDHRSRTVTPELLEGALAVFCMTETHRAMIQVNFDPPPQHVYLIRQFMPDAADPEIPDPYGLAFYHYEACRDSMVEAIPSVVRFIKDLVAQHGRG
jgi:protein-tyrosine-phosphatase